MHARNEHGAEGFAPWCFILLPSGKYVPGFVPVCLILCIIIMYLAKLRDHVISVNLVLCCNFCCFFLLEDPN